MYFNYIFLNTNVYNIILYRAQVFEEEDFQPALYSYHYFNEISEQRVIGMMREVDESINHLLKSNTNSDVIYNIPIFFFIKLQYVLIIIFYRVNLMKH